MKRATSIKLTPTPRQAQTLDLQAGFAKACHQMIAWALVLNINFPDLAALAESIGVARLDVAPAHVAVASR